MVLHDWACVPGSNSLGNKAILFTVITITLVGDQLKGLRIKDVLHFKAVLVLGNLIASNNLFRHFGVQYFSSIIYEYGNTVLHDCKWACITSRTVLAKQL